MSPLPATINTFGFGYEIRSGLLKSIAEAGNGNYAFIPDAGMIVGIAPSLSPVLVIDGTRGLFLFMLLHTCFLHMQHNARWRYLLLRV
jgi:hypothetical protein